MERTILDRSLEERVLYVIDLDREYKKSTDEDDRAYYDTCRAEVIDTELRQLGRESLNYWAQTGEGVC